MKTKATTFARISAFALVMAICLLGTFKSSGNAHRAFDGYYREAKTGQTFNDYYCGQNIYVYLYNADDEIDIGTHVWADLALTVPFPDGIITSKYGSTYNQSFYISSGVVYGYATPLNCMDPLTDPKK